MNRVVPLRSLCVVDRHTEAQHVRAFLRARKHQPVTDLPVVGVFRFALQQPAFDNAVLGEVASDLLMPNSLPAMVCLPRHFSCIVAKDAVQPLDVNRIQNILDGLNPIAGGNGLSYFAPTILFDQQIPTRHQRRRLGAQIREDQSTQLRHGITPELNLVFRRLARVKSFFKRLLEAAAQAVIFPSVVGAPQAIIFWNTVNQIGPAMGAVSVDQAEPSLCVFEQHEFFAQNPDELGGMARQFRSRGDRVPVAAQEVAHRCSCSNFRQPVIVLLTQHVISYFLRSSKTLMALSYFLPVLGLPLFAWVPHPSMLLS